MFGILRDGGFGSFFKRARFATGTNNFQLVARFLSTFDVPVATCFLIGIASQKKKKKKILTDVSSTEHLATKCSTERMQLSDDEKNVPPYTYS